MDSVVRQVLLGHGPVHNTRKVRSFYALPYRYNNSPARTSSQATLKVGGISLAHVTTVLRFLYRSILALPG